MKPRWLITVCATLLLAFITIAAVAQDRDDRNRGDDNNRGQNQRYENRGQRKKRYRQFNQRQQRYARTYYNQNHDQEVFRRDDRWTDDDERRIQPGYVLDDDMRRMSRPAPYEMTREMGRPPRGYRYVVIGGHVVLIDGGYRVHDAIHFEINLGH
jgi:hypothetical protein